MRNIIYFKRHMWTLTALVAALAGSGSAVAANIADAINIAQVAIAGTGCSDYAPGVFAFSEKTGEATVSFPAYEVNADAGGSERIARANCSLALPFTAPAGFRLRARGAFLAGGGKLSRRRGRQRR